MTPGSHPLHAHLRTCLAATWNRAALAQARVMAQTPQFDWEAWVELAHAEGVDALLFPLLRDQAWLPAAPRLAMSEAYMHTAARNTLLLAELEQVLALLAAADIPAIALKGMALAEHVYSNPATRPMVDLDLLLHATDIPAAVAQLARLGYRSAAPEPAAGLTLAFENELLLWREERIELLLELHWHLFDSPHHQRILPVDWFWSTARPAQFGQSRALMLGPEALLLHLCGHLALHHHGQGLVWQFDIAEVIAAYHPSLDWDGLLAKAQEFDLVLPLQRALTAAASDWQAPIPPAVLSQVEALRPSSAEQQVFARLAVPDRPVIRRFWDDLASMASWRARWRYAWKQLLPTPVYMQQRYQIANPRLTPFYYPWRWWMGLRGLLAHTRGRLSPRFRRTKQDENMHADR